MPDEKRIRQRLEEMMESNATPDEVCADDPELLQEVRLRWQQLRQVEDQIEAIFPSSGHTAEELRVASLQLGGPLPRIEGYDIEAVLGRGGMGVVYKARHLKLNRTVALKMLLAGAFAGPQEIQRFLREAQAVAGLRHANIVQVYDAGDVAGQPYFTMELIEGGSLAQALAGVPQPARRAAALVATLADAVQFAHQKGIIHRDLKPANILLAVASGQWSVVSKEEASSSLTTGHWPLATVEQKITDFGLARSLEAGPEFTLSGARVGTPSYMAPEQALGQIDAIGPAVDIYALGAILYEMLTGRPPFKAATASETERQVIAQEPAPPSRLNASVPRDLETICLKCLQKDPTRRYASSQELGDDLRHFLNGQPILARPAGVGERLIKWVRRRPTLAVLMIGCLLAAFALLAVLLRWHWQQAALTEAVHDDLVEVRRYENIGAWPQAHTALERAKGRLCGGGPSALQSRVALAEQDLDLVAKLGAIHEGNANVLQRQFNYVQTDRDYRHAFQQAGLGLPGEDAGVVAARIAASDVRDELVTALGNWAQNTTDTDLLHWLLEVARRADPDTRWRDRVRDPSVWSNQLVLTELARSARVTEESVPVLLMVADRLQATGGDGVGFLRRVQFAHPDDFWVNFKLAELLDARKDQEAIGYYRAALALRPCSVAVLGNLGACLALNLRYAEALDCFRRALELEPDSVVAHCNFAGAFLRMSRFDEAIAHARQAIAIDPRLPIAHGILGHALMLRGRFSEAHAALRHVQELCPATDYWHTNAGKLLEECEQLIQMEHRLPAALAQEQSLSAFDEMKFARFCIIQQRPVTAARLAAAAFTKEPKLFADARVGHGYHAACAAAATGCGREEAGLTVSEEGKTRYRALARQWLHSDLASWSRLLQGGKPADRKTLRFKLTQWQVDPHLAGLREPNDVDKLPAAEQQECFKIWAEVDSLLKRAQE